MPATEAAATADLIIAIEAARKRMTVHVSFEIPSAYSYRKTPWQISTWVTSNCGCTHGHTSRNGWEPLALLTECVAATDAVVAETEAAYTGLVDPTFADRRASA